MRWQALFADLEHQFVSSVERGEDAERTERAIAERASLSLLDRIRPGASDILEVHVTSGQVVVGQALARGRDWFALGRGSLVTLVPTWSVAYVVGLRSAGLEPRTRVEQRLSLAQPLRRLSVSRREVGIVAAHAQHRGRLIAVGIDHVDLAMAGRLPLPIPCAAIEAVAIA